jgi:hypothetical protein
MPADTIRVFENTFCVRGAGPFPLDMLRYECAYPATEADANLMGPSHREERTVRLISRMKGDNDPAAARWRSFGWVVESVP